MRPRYEASRRDVTSKSIDGVTDLVIWAPIKDGFIDAFVNVTYETRLRIVAEALHNVRVASREFEIFEPYADTAKRILSLLDFRIGIVDRDIFGLHEASGVLRPRKYMYLVATFDGPWEPYIREIWRPLGSFLDLVLCNCEGYESALDLPFDKYAQWVRDNQLDSAIFYATSGQTVEDKIYLSDVEWMQRNWSPSKHEEAIARHRVVRPTDAAERTRAEAPVEAARLGMEGLNVLYKLTDYYPPISPSGSTKHDGRFLLKAGQDLLDGLTETLNKLPQEIQDFLNEVYRDQLAWFQLEVPPSPTSQINPDEFSKSDVQKGVLTSYDQESRMITHGALLNSQITDSAKFRTFLSKMKWSWEDDEPAAIFDFPLGDGIVVNIAFTFQGLKSLGVPETELLNFPKEFRQGMQERAPSMGDKFSNHPRNWTLPERNWPQDSGAFAPAVEPKEIDFAIQIRAHVKDEFGQIEESFHEFRRAALTRRKTMSAEIAELLPDIKTSIKQNDNSNEKVPLDTPLPQPDINGPASGLIQYIANNLPSNFQAQHPTSIDVAISIFDTFSSSSGFQIINVEDMMRRDRTKDTTKDHFDFTDGISQPEVVPKWLPNQSKPWHVLLGDVVYGYPNTLQSSPSEDVRDQLRFQGTYMVVRKIQQHRDALDELEQKYGEPFIEKLVGRKRDGTPLVKSNGLNDFDYQAPNVEDECPYSAHIRLANP